MPVNGPTLDTLLYAHHVAQQRGQLFDIEAYLTPEMRAEWLRREAPWVRPGQDGQWVRYGWQGFASGPAAYSGQIHGHGYGYDGVGGASANGLMTTVPMASAHHLANGDTPGGGVDAPTQSEAGPSVPIARPATSSKKRTASTSSAVAKKHRPSLTEHHWASRKRALEEEDAANGIKAAEESIANGDGVNTDAEPDKAEGATADFSTVVAAATGADTPATPVTSGTAPTSGAANAAPVYVHWTKRVKAEITPLDKEKIQAGASYW